MLDPAIAIFGASLIFVLAMYGLRFLYDYRIKDGSINVMLFRLIPVYKLPIRDIEYLEQVSWWKLGFAGTTLRYGNRFNKLCLLIGYRNGFFSKVVITPENIETFIEEICSSDADRHDGAISGSA